MKHFILLKPSNHKTRACFPGALRAAALLGLCILSPVVSSFAAFVPLPEETAQDPGVELTDGTAAFTGTVIAAQDSVFDLSPDFRGVLRSMVVDTGLGYDFYYQIVNTGTDPGTGAEIFRMKTAGGFDGATLTVTYRPDFIGLNFASFSGGPAGGVGAYQVGTKPLFSADRDEGSTGSVGFDFSEAHFLFDASNLQPSETGMFAVVRTNLNTYAAVNVDVSGNNTARIASFALVPEPHAATLATMGATLLLRRRRENARFNARRVG